MLPLCSTVDFLFFLSIAAMSLIRMQKRFNPSFIFFLLVFIISYIYFFKCLLLPFLLQKAHLNEREVKLQSLAYAIFYGDVISTSWHDRWVDNWVERGELFNMNEK